MILADASEVGGGIATVIGFLVLLNFIPTIVASARGRSSLGAIFAFNLLLGWSVIGWIWALIWALTDDDATRAKKAAAAAKSVSVFPPPDPPRDLRAAIPIPTPTRQCPHCLSDVPIAASVCRYCQRDLPAS